MVLLSPGPAGIGYLDALRARRSNTVPSKCRADDGTGNVGRYDRRMETWMVTLIVAGIAAFTTIGVAWVNGRGESAELKQLRALNEALAAMPTSAFETERLRKSRDALALRVAAWVDQAPSRRRLGLAIAGAVVSLAVTIVALALSGLDFTAPDGPLNSIVAVATIVATGAVTFFAWGTARRVRAAVSDE